MTSERSCDTRGWDTVNFEFFVSMLSSGIPVGQSLASGASYHLQSSLMWIQPLQVVMLRIYTNINVSVKWETKPQL